MWELESASSASSDNNQTIRGIDEEEELTSPEETPNYLLHAQQQQDQIPIPMISPHLLSSSPVKKVQFQVGGGGDEETQDHAFQMQALNDPAGHGGGTGSGGSTNRAEKADYGGGGTTTVPLLPAIAEEKSSTNGNKRMMNYQHSVSMIDTVRFGLAHADPVPEEHLYGFVELDVLSGEGDLSNREWKEIARWIKYEEDLEPSGRFGKPHIASLSFLSLLKLRQLIERDGVVMLDMAETDMPGIAYRIVEELAGKGLVKADETSQIMRVLLLKHRHVQEPAQWFGLKRTNTSVSSLQNLYDEKALKKVAISTDPCVLVRRNSSMIKTSTPIDIKPTLQRTSSGNYLKPPTTAASCPPTTISTPPEYESLKDKRKESYGPSEEDLKWIGRRDTVRRLLPTGGAESTIVMVGEFDSLRKPLFVFVRLLESQLLFNVTEIPVPARFFSILLAPSSLEMDVVEIGRAFGALMSNKHFFELALRANGRKNLLTGINEFLESSIVLPPGDWDNHDLLPIHVLQQRSNAIRNRRMKKQFSFVRPNESVADGISLITPQPPEEEKGDGYDPFKRTGRLFGGMVNDMRKRFPYYKSDFTDALNFQCLSTIIFMYFASIGLIITFAGLMGEKTEEMIGMSETLIGTSIAGIFFTLLSGQPLIPMGPTGALLVFDEILFNFCRRYEIEFLSLRAWISCWLLLITFLVVAFEGSVLVKWFTKFTQDIFAALTALLLMWESVDNLIDIYERHPLSAHTQDKRPVLLNISTTNYSLVFEETTANPFDEETEDLQNQPNTALLSTILMLGTFFLAYFLKEFRNSIFLGEKARRALGDFGVPIAIMTMVFLDVLVTDTYTRKINVPEGFQPSSPNERGWLIHPFGRDGTVGTSVILGSLGPALLLFILIFMSQQICELLISAKERHLVKGSGFHYDLVLVAIINLASGFFGLPWLCCATVRALGHVTALTVYSKNNPPGQKPTIVRVHEQRLTNLAVSILVGCSVLLGPLLVLIPMAVLFGVFLYMGFTSLVATQFFDRFSLFFIPVESHPQTIYVRKVRTWKMHIFTLIQMSCLGLLWIVKSIKAISIAFPLFFILLVPIRLQLSRFYTDSELEALDGKLPK